jgi:hypothetical protein
MIISLAFNLVFFVLFSYLVVTKQRCMFGHLWSRWTEWALYTSRDYDSKIVLWKQERICKRCFKGSSRELGRHKCSSIVAHCPHESEYLSLVDEAINIKQLEKELGI